MAAIATPTVIINNIPIKYKPNSLTYGTGKGERKIRVATGGGSVKETIVTTDIETAFSTVKFMLYTTSDNVELVDEWIDNLDSNTVQWTDVGISRSVTNAVVVNNPDISMGVEGEFEVEFQGDTGV